MKKILMILSIFLLLPVFTLKADANHVFIEDQESYISNDQYRSLNEDLLQIESNYDIAIYFVYDTSIANSDSDLLAYVRSFLNSHNGSTNNVVLALNSSYYAIDASGPQADLVKAQEDTLWNLFYNEASQISSSYPDGFYNGIRNYYQRVVKIINDATGTYEQSTVKTGNDPLQDLAGLLSESEKADISNRLQKISDRYDFDVVILTVNSYDGKTAQAYADDVYDYNGFRNDGLIFVLNMSDRSWHMSTKGKAVDYFTDYGIDQIFEDMRGDLANNNYHDAFVTFADDCSTYIANGRKGNIVDTNNPDGKNGRNFGSANLVISAIIAGIAAFFSDLRLVGQMKSVRSQHAANNYIVNNSFNLTGASDMLVNRTVSRRPRQQDRPSNRGSGGGGGGSSVHTSSSGSTHGGHGGHF